MALETLSLRVVQDYYGRILRKTSDLKTTACCIAEQLPINISSIVSRIHPDVRETFYGCGVIAPADLRGRTVLDLGCGSGRDAFVLSHLVGPEGRVIGVDMTEEQLAIGRRHLDFHAQAFGYARSNVTFLQGYIEDLASLGITDESIDIIVSNCVINLSPDKERVFREAFRVLKPGGEMHFSDVFADRRLPAVWREDPLLLGECLGGAMYHEDFRRLMMKVGCQDVRTVASAPIAITAPDLAQKIGEARFTSLTLRAFKLDLEDRCEDYRQVATYLGTLPESPATYILDDHHVFEVHRPVPVCGNTAKMLQETRLASHFKVEGDMTKHFGLFACAPKATARPAAGCC